MPLKLPHVPPAPSRPTRPGRPAGPQLVAVEGPPGAGVGAFAARLAEASGARLVRDVAGENPFLLRFADDPRGQAFAAQVYFLLARFRQQGELLQGDLFAPGGVVVDYLFARDRLWARLTLSPEELILYERIHELLGARVPTPDLVVYLTARSEILRARLAARVRATDRVVAGGLVEQIAAEMSGYFFRYEASPLLVVNTSEVAAVESPRFLDEIVGVARRVKAGVHHYNPS